MKRVLLLLVFLLLAGCAGKELPPVVVEVPTRPIDYQREVKPLLDKRCTVCHSCYNSPCQLKLDSFEGVDRGATKKAVYNSLRLSSMEPTRLFTDARTTGEWRKKGFTSVTGSSANTGWNDSLIIQMLAHKMKTPRSIGEYRSEAEDLTCAENNGELGSYLEKHPNNGMPFGFPPLKQEEFALIAGWLAQGAKGPDAVQQQELTAPAAADAPSLAGWENFLNRGDAKHAMTARYLYEHLFLAHITFGTGSNAFYELVRSRTPPDQPLDLIASVRPYDDPGVARVFYRFRRIHSTIVHKTHMVFSLDHAQLNRCKELFIDAEWPQPPHPVGYETRLSANPFAAFEQIPPRARYQFLLDNAHYIIMTFIHGPVCKGQIALNVIDDQFWIMFLDPDHDLSVVYPGFLKINSDRLRMPIENGSDQRIFSALTDQHRKASAEFYRARQDFYASLHYYGLGYDAIWRGKRAEDAPLMTVYRHFDSASVHKGALGDLPKTAWVLDYPLLERIYYALVAGFDVYGTAGHQLAIRLYMDGLRGQGESNFLDFLPADRRMEIIRSWYKGVDMDRVGFSPSALPAKIRFATDDPKREFIEYLVDSHLLPAAGIAFDPVNYRRSGVGYPRLPDRYGTEDDYLRAFRAVSQPGTPFFSMVDNSNANLGFVRIRRENGRDMAFSMVINRWHDNVAFMINEESRLDPSRDSADFIPGLIGSYPNYFFDVEEKNLADFLHFLAHFDNSPHDRARLLAEFGVNRANDRFWETYDWFQQRFYEEEPVLAGLFDLNRYYHRAAGEDDLQALGLPAKP